ncbi:hypothetical protein [Candidatus Nitrosopumilus sediminis]|nr:hypothetical protein [Candidatus Nitrosopumilus sediminis]
MNNKINKLSMIIVSIIIASSLSHGYALAESEITLVLEKTVFEPTARIFLTGTVVPGDAFYELVTIVVYDSNGNKIIQDRSNVEDGKFSALITGPLGSFDKGVYGIEASHVSATNKALIVIGINDLVHDQSTGMYLTPLKQIELGTNAAQVICMDKHMLVQSNHRDSVACVEPLTAISLETRGWGTLY